MSEYFAAPSVTSNSTTANAGTNLNTSALALEAGGNLAAIYAKLITTLAATQSGTWTVGSKNQDGSGTSITSTNVSGKQGLDVNEIDRLIEERRTARLAKDWKRADEIRRALAERKIILQDTPAGTTWKSE